MYTCVTGQQKASVQSSMPKLVEIKKITVHIIGPVFCLCCNNLKTDGDYRFQNPFFVPKWCRSLFRHPLPQPLYLSVVFETNSTFIHAQKMLHDMSTNSLSKRMFQQYRPAVDPVMEAFPLVKRQSSHASTFIVFCLICRFFFLPCRNTTVSELYFCPSLESDAQLKDYTISSHTDKDLRGAPVGSTAFTVITVTNCWI